MAVRIKTKKKSRLAEYCDGDRKFKAGNPGRPKGIPNKANRPFTTLKQSFLDAYNDPQLGGTQGLVTWVLKNDEHRRYFYAWITKMLPRTVDVGGLDPVTPTNLSNLRDEELDAVLIGVGKALEKRQS